MPPDSAFHRRGKQWTQSHELAALVVEKVEARLATLAVMWADDKSKRKIDPPIVVTHHDRPVAVAVKKKKVVSPAGIAGMFGGR